MSGLMVVVVVVEGYADPRGAVIRFWTPAETGAWFSFTLCAEGT
jgi:hypothetical protein